jgi:hypothetical protein
LQFALAFSEEHGYGEPWTIPDLVQRSSQRSFAYPEGMIVSVAEDLTRERKLKWDGTRGKVAAHRVDEVRKVVDDWVRQYPVEVLEPIVRDLNLESGAKESVEGGQPPMRADVVRRVFIVHGHDEAKRRELVELLRTRFGLDPVVMKENPGRSKTFIEKFEDLAKECDAAIAVMTPDDVVNAPKDEYAQPRPNVLFELGWFAGHLGRDRTLMIAKEGVNIPSDLYGIEQIRFRNDISEKIPELERELEAWGAAKIQ